MNFSITHPPGSWSWEQVKKIKNENWIFICKQILFLNVQSTILFALDSDDIVYMHASVATLKASCFSVSQWMTTHHRRLFSYTPLHSLHSLFLLEQFKILHLFVCNYSCTCFFPLVYIMCINLKNNNNDVGKDK